MKTLASAAALAVALSLSGCGGSSHRSYPLKVQAEFLTACEFSGGASARCGCALSNIEAHVTLSGFISGESTMESTHLLPTWVENAIVQCG
jgi:hypothetical protein